MRKTIAVDFDGCLCKENWPEIGAPNLDVIKAVIKEQQHGSAIILWTCREGEKLDEAVRFCKSYGLEFDAVNENLPERIKLYGNDCRKIGADEYWDDRAVHMPAIRAQQKTERFRAKLIDRHNELLKQAIQDEDLYLSHLAGGISGVIRMLDEEEHNEPLTLDELISTCKPHRTCSVCTKTDGIIYTSSPPMVCCTVDGKFHAPDSECTLNLDAGVTNADRIRAMSDEELAVVMGVVPVVSQNGSRQPAEEANP